jgi:hypothetical protein
MQSNPQTEVLAVEAEYTLERGLVAEAIGRDVDLMMPRWPMAQQDGALLIGAKVRADGGAAHCRDLTPVLTEDPRSPYDQSWTPVALAAGALYIQNTGRALRVPADAALAPVALTVCHDNAAFRAGASAHLVASGSRVAVPLETFPMGSPHWLAVLHIDTDRQTVTWQCWGADSAAPPLSKEHLVTLKPGDFPGALAFGPLIHQALIRDKRLFVFARGDSDSPKGGYPYAAIAEIGPDGRVCAMPFLEDFTALAPKKHGLACRFAADGRHAILTPVYKATDPWAGKQGLFDLDTGALRLAAMPRGFGKFRIIDLNAGRLWAWDTVDQNTVRVVALRLA